MKRFLPRGLSIIIPTFIINAFVVGVLGAVSVFLILHGYGYNTEEIVFGAILFVVAISLCIAFTYWIMYVLRIEIKPTSIICCDLSVRPRQLNNFECTFLELKRIEINNGKLYNLIYQDGNVRTVNLKSFSKKQKVRIELEILKNACKLNDYSVDVVSL